MKELAQVRYQVALQVRLGSRRLPRKALLPLAMSVADNRCVLDWVLRHLGQSQKSERFLLLCPEQDRTTLEPYAQYYGFELFSGPEQDVWQRFALALERYPSKYCFRVTADNPLVPGTLLDFMAEQWEQKLQYSTPDYYWIKGLPKGFAAELLCSKALIELVNKPLQEQDHEHVTSFLYQHPEYYTVCYDTLTQLLGSQFQPVAALRLTLDTPEDYVILQQVFTLLWEQQVLSTHYVHFQDILEILLKQFKNNGATGL